MEFILPGTLINFLLGFRAARPQKLADAKNDLSLIVKADVEQIDI
jgi:hypothetical protein